MKNYKNILIWILKIGVLFLMVYFIYAQLKAKGINFSDVFSEGGVAHSDNYFFLIGAFVLMFVNWGLESLKWKTLINVILKSFSFLESLRCVLMGVCLGFITPNRIGEFGGRVLTVGEGNRIKAFALAFRGGIAQFVVTFSFGLVSALFVYNQLLSSNILYALFFLLLFGLLFVYYNFNRFAAFVMQFKFLKRFIKFEQIDVFISNKVLTKVFFLTILRYLIYINQYILLCYFFAIDVNYMLLFSIVSAMILSQTIGFSYPLLDLPYRGGVLLFLLQDYTDNQLNILLVILLVWILNLVLPTIVGYLNFLNLKLEVKNEKSNFNS